MTDCVSGFEYLGMDNHHDPLAVWKVIAPNYPTIALMAREILSIPAASVGVERTFSIARHQLRYNRQYNPQMFETIMMVRHGLDSRKSAEERDKTEAQLMSGLVDEAAIAEYAETQAEAAAIMSLDEISDDEEDGAEEDGVDDVEDDADDDTDLDAPAFRTRKPRGAN